MRALEKGDFKQQLKVYRELVGLAVDAILTGDSDGNFTSANKSATELTGYSVAELSTMNIEALFNEEERQRAPLRYDLLKQGEVVVTERMLTRKDGSTVPVEMKSRMLSDGGYHAFIRDLSERRAAEAALRHSEEKFSRAFHLSPNALSITRLKDAKLIEVNEGFSRLIGWSKEEAIGHSALPQDLNIWVDEHEREKLTKALLEQGEVVGQKVRLRHKSGRVGIGLMAARVIEIGDELCIIAITRDITDQEKMRKEREKLEAQMLQAQKLESLGVLAGGIAHDFNNILMTVLGHCELAQRKLPSESPVLQNIGQIRSAANKASDLANQMLAYSGKGQFVIEPCNLSVLLEEMRQMLEVSVSKKAQLSFSLIDELPSIEGDLTQLRQIVLNLVINASDALAGENGYVKVSTSKQQVEENELFIAGTDQSLPAGCYVVIEVADNGSGMDEETSRRIFEPFFTTKFAGRGLGMAAVLGIVRGHRGALTVDSTPGSGTRINVYLPGSMQEASVEVGTGVDTRWKGEGLVLLADDDPDIIEIGKQLLETLGFEVKTAADGQEALELYACLDPPPRVVILDLTMPRMGGEEAFSRISKLQPQQHVLFSSGYNEQEITIATIDHRRVGFLKKPYTVEALQQALKELIDGPLSQA